MNKKKSIVTLPFRMVRFGAALLRDGRPDFLCLEVASYINSLYNFPWFVLNNAHNLHPHNLVVKTNYPIAYTSPDHITPHGTLHNDITHYGFIRWATETFKGKPMTYLDLGCSSGRLVQDMWYAGWESIGIEGSDTSKKLKRSAWLYLTDHILYTADIGKPFTICKPPATKPEPFSLITAWQVLEHLTTTDIEYLCYNIQRHSAKNTCFVATTSSCSDTANGIELHRTRQSVDDWYRMLMKLLPGWLPFVPMPKYKQVRRCTDKGGNAICLVKMVN